MSWEEEKQKYLKMGIDEKRQHYNIYINLDDLPTWKKYAKSKKLLPKIDMLPNCAIDNTKNSILVNKISCFCGDITHLEIDAIVNTTNSTLLGEGHVGGAINNAAGRALIEECRALRRCPLGEAKITGGYRLPSKYVIHTVGPQGEQIEMLRNCYKNSLRLMWDNNLKSIAFPCISTGMHHYPNLPAAHVALYTVRRHLEANANIIDRVIFCLFTDEDKDIYERLLQSYFPLN